MQTKIRSAKFKAVDGRNPGTFSAVVAVYGNVDSVGDRILEGAFDKSLKEWQALGDPIPIVLAHEWKDPFKHIGYAMPNKIKSVPGVGLVVEEGHLDIEDNPLAKQVHKLMQRKTLKEFSFGYGIPQGGQTKASDGAMDLRMLDLIEFGPCLKGVNDKTELLSIKSQLHTEDDMLTFEERLERIEAILMENVKGLSPGRARWRSQKRHPETGRWIDETSGAGFEGRKRTVSSKFGAAKIDSIRSEANSNPDLSGSDKSMVNRLLNEAEERFLAGDNKGGESKVEMAAGIKPVKPLMTSSGAREQHMEFLQGQVDDKFISPKVRAEAAAELAYLRDNPQKVAASLEQIADYIVAPFLQSQADEKEESDFNARISEAQTMLNDPNADQDELDNLMADLHVDSEQAEYKPFTESRYSELEKRWLDQGSSDNGNDAVSTGQNPDDDFSANKQEIESVNRQMDSIEKMLKDPNTIDSEELDDAMGDLHVDMEQSNFPEELELRHADLEQEWRDREDAAAGITRSPGDQALMSEASNLVESGNASKIAVSAGTISEVRSVTDKMNENNQISDSELADVQDLLDQAQYFLNDGLQEEAQYQYDIVRAMMEIARKKAAKKSSKSLDLDDQISTMQSEAAIATAEASLLRDGMSAFPSKSDETMRRLAELEEELG